MINLLNTIPWYLSVAFFVFIIAAFTAFFFYFARTVVSRLKISPGDEQKATTFSLNTLALIYSIFVVLVFIDVQSQHNQIQDIVVKEASILTDMYQTSQLFTIFPADTIRQAVNQYVRNILEVELPLMQAGLDYALVPYIHPQHLWAALAAINPTTEKEVSIYSVILRRLGELTDTRFQRFTSVDGRTTPFIWTVLIYGALITIASSLMYSVHPKIMNLVLLSFNVSLLVLVLMLIYSLDKPFCPPTNVSLKAFQEVLQLVSIHHN